jgi:hypothetical protein
MPQYRRAKIEGGVFFFTAAFTDMSSRVYYRRIGAAVCKNSKALLASEWWARRERAFAHPTQTDPDLAEQALESEQSFLIIVVAAKRRTVGWAKPTGRANARPMINSACPPSSVVRHEWWARRKRAFAHPTNVIAMTRKANPKPHQQA